jgi:hypothetical protein
MGLADAVVRDLIAPRLLIPQLRKRIAFRLDFLAYAMVPR